jgi:hypothetical protein
LSDGSDSFLSSLFLATRLSLRQQPRGRGAGSEVHSSNDDEAYEDNDNDDNDDDDYDDDDNDDDNANNDGGLDKGGWE